MVYLSENDRSVTRFRHSYDRDDENGKTKYLYQGRFYKLSELYQKSTEEVTAEAILSSIIVQPCAGQHPVKIVFVKNHSKQSAWLAIMTDDLTLSSQEIVKTYSPLQYHLTKSRANFNNLLSTYLLKYLQNHHHTFQQRFHLLFAKN